MFSLNLFALLFILIHYTAIITSLSNVLAPLFATTGEQAKIVEDWNKTGRVVGDIVR